MTFRALFYRKIPYCIYAISIFLIKNINKIIPRATAITPKTTSTATSYNISAFRLLF